MRTIPTTSEVQRPLTEVVIGGLVFPTILTLLVLTSLYKWFFINGEGRSKLRGRIKDLLESDYGISHSTLEMEDSSEGHRCGDEEVIHPKG